MDGQRIGQLLQELGKLSALDIHEVLAEQRSWPRRFGEIAVTLGFCEPEHVWSAWCSQLGGSTGAEEVNLDEVGVDAQAADHLPAEIAWAWRVMPLRAWEGRLVIAVADPSTISVLELTQRAGMEVKIVRASKAQIEKALRTYYPQGCFDMAVTAGASGHGCAALAH